MAENLVSKADEKIKAARKLAEIWKLTNEGYTDGELIALTAVNSDIGWSTMKSDDGRRWSWRRSWTKMAVGVDKVERS